MSLSHEFSKATEYAKGIFRRLGDLLVLLIISVIPVVNLMALGYYAKILSDSSTSETPPKFEDFGEMFVSGLKIVLVGILYVTVVLIASLVLGWGFLISMVRSIISLEYPRGFPMVPRLTLLLLALPFILLVLIIGFIVSVVAVMGGVHMFKQKSLGKAFALGEIFGIIGKVGWLRYLGFLLAYLIVSGIISAVAGLMSFTFTSVLTIWVMYLLFPLISVPITIFFVRTISMLYDNAVRPSNLPQPTAQPPTST